MKLSIAELKRKRKKKNEKGVLTLNTNKKYDEFVSIGKK
jgi:hypothetical protein